jgi:hypothetical protein
MATIAALTVRLGANSAQLHSGVNSSMAKLREFEQYVNHSGMRTAAMWIKGAGSIGIMIGAMRGLESASRAMSELLPQLREGTLGWSAALSQIASQIPVIGQAMRTGTAIGDMLGEWSHGGMSQSVYADPNRNQRDEASRQREEAKARLIEQRAFLGKLNERARTIDMDEAGRLRDAAYQEFMRTRQMIEKWRQMEGASQSFTDFTAAMENAERIYATMNRQADELQGLQDGADIFINRLQEEIETYGMAADAVELYRLELAGVDDARMNAARSMMEQLDAIKAEHAAIKELELAEANWARTASRVFESTRTPMEKYAEKLEELNELLTRGLIDADTYARALDQAGEMIKPTMREQEQPKLMRVGSAEAQRFMYESGMNRQKDDTPKKQLTELQRITRVMERSEQILKDQGVLVMDIGAA